MKIFNNVASLKLAKLSSGYNASTKGYYAENDRGGAEYIIKTSVEFGGTPDGYGDFAIANGNIAVLQVKDKYNVRQFGVRGGGADNTSELTAAIAASSGNLYFPKDTYDSSDITYAGEINAELEPGTILSFSFKRPTRAGNLYSIDNRQPSLGQLGTDQNNPAEPENQSICITRGDSTTPDTTTRYAETAVYTEVHTNAAPTDPISVWGNSYKIPAITVEIVPGDAAEGEFNGGAFRSYSTDIPADIVTTGKRNLVGVSAIGQTNTGSGNESWGVFGANFVAAETSGNAAPNCVGIEVDVIHQVSADYTVAPSSGNNYTGFWAQSDAQGGVYSHTAFYASRSASSGGWANILRYSGPCYGPMLVLRNNRDDADARGGLFEIYNEGASSSILQAQVTNATRTDDISFKVTGEPANPVFVKVDSTLQRVTVGAADSGGAGFRVLRVPN